MGKFEIQIAVCNDLVRKPRFAGLEEEGGMAVVLKHIIT